MSSDLSNIKALSFDVFGTCVDFRGSIIKDCRAWGKAKGLRVNWAKFTDAWRAGYRPAMDRVTRGELPWTKIDALHRLVLDDLLVKFRINGLTEEEKDHLNRVWHRLKPWPDTVKGLKRMKKHYIISTLSNGNTSLLVNMAKFGGLPWDCVFSLDLKPEQVMMVAAHKHDLFAAAKNGLKTAFVRRPHEHGRNANKDLADEPSFTLNADDMVDLAAKLGC